LKARLSLGGQYSDGFCYTQKIVYIFRKNRYILTMSIGGIASHEAVADMISEVNNTLTSGFTMLDAGLQELCFIKV